MSLFESASLVVTPNGTKASKLYAIKPTDGSGDLSVTRATTATRVNTSGLVSSVAVNVPRLDYTNSTCPSILVEPQRANLTLYSEQFNDINWVKDGFTISSNSTTSPDGTNTADKLVSNALSGNKIAFQIVTTAIGTVYTTSAYFKASEYNLAFIRLGGVTGNPYVIYNLSNQAVVSSSGSITHTIQLISNGWYKITVTVTATSLIIAPVFSFLPTTGYTLDDSNIPQYTGNGVNGGFIWGAQVEAGSYATSYIPTTSASVTRNADVISKTGISSLIGQTEGTIFLDWIMNREAASTSEDVYTFAISDGTSSNVIALNNYNNALTVFCITGGSTQFSNNSFSGSTGQRIKLAIAYKLNDIALYINGNQIATDTSATIPAMSKINIGSWVANNFQDYISVNTNAIWKTRLSNSELATLTTI